MKQKAQQGRNSSLQAKQKQLKKQKLQRLGIHLPVIASSTQRLQSKINQFKNNHAELTKKLQQSILNNNLYKSLSSQQFQKIKHNQFLDSKHYKKQRSISVLSKNIQKRIQDDVQAQRLLQKMEKQVHLKRSATQKKLKQIQERNQQKIQQIQQFQKNFIFKIKEQMIKNIEKQKRLKKEFQKLKKQNNQLIKVKQTQSKIDQQGWKILIDKKVNLQKIMSNQLKQQKKLIQQKDPQISKKQQIKVTKQKQQKRVRVKLDLKQAGRQYLDFAKKSGSNTANQKKKKLNTNYLNVNLKVINYDNQILQKIVQNRGRDLLLENKEQALNQQGKVKQKNQQNLLPINQNLKHATRFQAEIKDHKKIQKYENNILPILQENNSQQNQKQSNNMKQTFFSMKNVNQAQ